MHRTLCLLIFLMMLPSLFADVYVSNELFQRLEQKAELEGSGWELDVSEDVEVLSLDGEIKGKRTFFSDGYQVERGASSERVFKDEKENVVRRIISDEMKSEEYNYFYKDGVLSSYTYSIDGELVSKVDYLDANKRLVAISGDRTAYLTRESLIYRDDDGNAVIIDEDGNVVDDEKSINDKGTLTELIDGVLYTYTEEGRIKSEKGDGYLIEYFYSDDGSLKKRTSQRGDVFIVDEYENSQIKKTTEYKGDVVQSVRTNLEGGIVEEIRYLSGNPRYRMFYDMDGRRLKEVKPL